MLWMALDGPGETGWTNSRRNCAGKGEAMSGRGHVARKQTSQGPRYYPVIELPHDPATGKRRQRWHPAHTSRRAADRELVRLLGQLDRGAYVEPSRLTVRAYLEVWLAGMAGKVEPNTLEVWTVYARAHVDPAIGHVLVQQLTATHLAAFYAGLADHGRRDGKGLAPKTVKNVHGLLHRALEDAVEQDLVARNVAGLKAARPAKVPRVERRVWAPEELRRFLAALAADRLAALWQLDCTTGLRRSELLGLPWAPASSRWYSAWWSWRASRRFVLGPRRPRARGGSRSTRRLSPCSGRTARRRPPSGSPGVRRGPTTAWCSPARTARRCGRARSPGPSTGSWTRRACRR